MLQIHLNSLSFKKALSFDTKIQVIISNSNQNNVKSVPVEYKKKENMALFSENLFLKDIKKQSSKDELSYYIIEVYEKTQHDKLIASKTFTSNDFFENNKVNLKTLDSNELTLHLFVEQINNEMKSGGNLLNKQSSMMNCADESFTQLDSQFGSPVYSRRFDQMTTQSNSQSGQTVRLPQNNENFSKSVNSKSENEGGEQIFQQIANSIKSGFLKLCEINPETDLDYLDMNDYTYQFVSKLGPVVAISNYLREIYKWTNLFQTLMYGVCATMIIFYPKAIILLTLIYTYIFTKRVIQVLFQLGIKKVEKVNIIDKNVNKMKNLKRNMIFLQENMRFYAHVYDQVCEFLFSDDKTQVIRNIQLFRNYSIFLVIGMIIVSFEYIIFSAFWFTLVGQTKYGKIFTTEGMIIIERLSKKVNRFIDQEIILRYFPRSVIEALPIAEKQSGLQKIVKKFIIQENQRWWLGKGWADLLIPGDIPKWSDIQGLKELKKEDFKLPEQNWTWENNGQWQIERTNDTDDEGWRYGKSFSDQTFIAQQKSLYYIRKRIWYKTCSCLVSYYEGDDDEHENTDYQIVQN